MKVPPYEKVSFCLGHNCPKAQAVLPSTHYSGLVRQTTTKGNEQSRGDKTLSFMGDRARRIRHTILTKDCDQGPSLGWLCC